MRRIHYLISIVCLAGRFCFGEQIGVVGTGYVGLVTGAIFSHWGHEVICVDIDRKKVEQLQQGIIPIFEPGLTELLCSSSSGKSIEYSDDIKKIAGCSIVYICLGTPLDAKGYCDCSAIDSAIEQIIALSPTPKWICIKSTVPPGTLRRLKQRLSDLKKGDIEIVFNPEFMRQGSALHDIFNKNPLVLGGELSGVDKIEGLYQPLLNANPAIQVIKTTFETAELIKYGWNGFSALRITYFNELSRLCRDLSADISVLIKGVALSEELLPTKEIKPGCGYGGSCLPKDTKAFSRVLEEHAIYPSLIHQTIASNAAHIKELSSSVITALGNTPERKIVTIVGLAFKANTDDIRDSPAIAIIEELQKQKVIVRAYDLFAIQKMKALFPEVDYFNSVYESLKNSDCMVVLTDSTEIKTMELSRIAKLMKRKTLVDLRNVFDPREAIENGFKIINVGRISTRDS